MHIIPTVLSVSISTFLIVPIAYANAFDPPPGQGMPKGTVGGGSRPSVPGCLIPSESEATPILLAPKRYLGLTTQSHPTFWVYLPATSAKTIEFSLFDHTRKGIYQVSLPIPSSAGLTAIPLPKAGPGLSYDRSYHWTIALVCNPKRRPEDWVTGGWIQRQKLSDRLQQTLNQNSNSIDQATSYLQSNFWYDALTRRLESPPETRDLPELTTLWFSAFDSAGIPVPSTFIPDRLSTRRSTTDRKSSNP